MFDYFKKRVQRKNKAKLDHENKIRTVLQERAFANQSDVFTGDLIENRKKTYEIWKAFSSDFLGQEHITHITTKSPEHENDVMKVFLVVGINPDIEDFDAYVASLPKEYEGLPIQYLKWPYAHLQTVLLS